MSITILPMKDFQGNNLTLHFSDLLSDKDYYPWFYENYINIYISGDKNYIIHYTDTVDYNQKLLSQNIEDYKIYNQGNIDSKETLKDILFETLSQGYYSIVWADEFFISSAYSCGKFHFVHPITVFGIEDGTDDSETFLHCQYFHHEKGTIKSHVFLCEMFQAIKNAIEYYIHGDVYAESIHRTIKAYKYKSPCKLPFDLNTFRLNFEDYLFSKPSAINRRLLYPGQSELAYGLKVYDVLINVLEHLDEKDISFTSLHHFVMSKFTLYERLEYINRTYNMDILKELAIYKQLCNSFSKMIQLNLKLNIKNGVLANSLSKDESYHQKLISTLKDNKRVETASLLSIYRKINKYLMSGNGFDEENNLKYTYTDNTIRITFGSAYVKEIRIFINKDYPVKIVGMFRTYDNELLTDKIVLGIKDLIMGNDHIRRINWFEYELLNNEDVNIRDIKFHIGFCDDDVLIDSKDLYSITPALDVVDNTGNQISYQITGRDPSINFCDLMLAEDNKYICIKCKIKSSSNTAQLFFNTYDEAYFAESKSKIFTVNNDNNYHLYKLDLSDNPEWRGVVKDIRFDPAQYDNTDFQGAVDMEYIKICKEPPQYGSDEDFSSVQGFNGWYYYTFDNGIAYREMLWDDDKYVGINDNKLVVTKDLQSSGDKFLTVRRFICPASGRYNITCSYQQKTNGTKTSLFIKRNHRLIYTDTDLLDGESVHYFEGTIDLERGEVIGFEFYNDDDFSVEEIQINCVIKRV